MGSAIAVTVLGTILCFWLIWWLSGDMDFLEKRRERKLNKKWHKEELAKTKDQEKVRKVSLQYYGLPFSPTGELQKRLPEIDATGRDWEIKVEADKKGEFQLVLSLVDLLTNGEPLATTTVSLARVNEHDRQSYADLWLERGEEFAVTRAAEQIIVPMLKWAQAEALKGRPGEVREYLLGTGPKKLEKGGHKPIEKV